MNVLALYERDTVICRIGSLENYYTTDSRIDSVICRIGSLEKS